MEVETDLKFSSTIQKNYTLKKTPSQKALDVLVVSEAILYLDAQIATFQSQQFELQRNLSIRRKKRGRQQG